MDMKSIGYETPAFRGVLELYDCEDVPGHRFGPHTANRIELDGPKLLYFLPDFGPAMEGLWPVLPEVLLHYYTKHL